MVAKRFLGMHVPWLEQSSEHSVRWHERSSCSRQSTDMRKRICRRMVRSTRRCRCGRLACVLQVPVGLGEVEGSRGVAVCSRSTGNALTTESAAAAPGLLQCQHPGRPAVTRAGATRASAPATRHRDEVRSPASACLRHPCAQLGPPADRSLLPGSTAPTHGHLAPRCWRDSGTEVGHHQKRFTRSQRDGRAPMSRHLPHRASRVDAARLEPRPRRRASNSSVSVAPSSFHASRPAAGSSSLCPGPAVQSSDAQTSRGESVEDLHYGEVHHVGCCAWRFAIALHVLTRKQLLAQMRRTREEAGGRSTEASWDTRHITAHLLEPLVYLPQIVSP